jgi:hypothetical protein
MWYTHANEVGICKGFEHPQILESVRVPKDVSWALPASLSPKSSGIHLGTMRELGKNFPEKRPTPKRRTEPIPDI